MRDFQGRRRWRRFLYSKVSVAVLVLACLMFGRSVWGIWQKNALTHERLEENELKMKALTAREALLRHEVATLETPGGVEAALREKFSVVRAGERVVTILPPASTTAAAAGTRDGFWQRFYDALFH